MYTYIYMHNNVYMLIHTTFICVNICICVLAHTHIHTYICECRCMCISTRAGDPRVNTPKCVAVCCSVLPCVAVCCSVYSYMNGWCVFWVYSQMSRLNHRSVPRVNMGWLWWVGSIKLKVSFAKEPYKRDDILQNRPIILRSLLIVATP